MKLFEGFKTTVLLLLTFPVWLPILLGLTLIFSGFNWKLDPVNHQNHEEGDFDGEM